ncbi:unnamed protein product [Closterium sp. NIES-53]
MVDGTKLPIHGETTLQLQIGALRWKPTLPITNIKGLDFTLGLNESNTGYLALVMAAAEEEKPNSELPVAVQEVLEKYKDIMPDDLPAGVPPARTHEHEIVEEPGAKPVSRAPYRLSLTKLTDMKKQIEYLLDRQLIRPSTSPYGALAEMNHILRPLLDECVVVYLDDILVYSKNMKEHVEHLRKFFEILRENKFYVKLSKSDFALKKVQFLGHMVSAEGVHVDPRKIEAVKKWKVSENVKEL